MTPTYREIDVYSLAGHRLGTAENFPEAKAMQLAALPADLAPAYAGIDTSGAPLFHNDALTDDLRAKYDLQDF